MIDEKQLDRLNWWACSNCGTELDRHRICENYSLIRQTGPIEFGSRLEVREICHKCGQQWCVQLVPVICEVTAVGEQSKAKGVTDAR